MEQEYTLKQYCVYVLRKWFVILGVAIIGIVLGALMGVTKKPDYTVEMYESFVRFNLEEYIDYKTDGQGIKVEGEQSTYSNTLVQMVEEITDSSLESVVYNSVKDGYKNTKATTEKKKSDEFFANLNAEKNGYQAILRFAYRIKSDEDRAFAKRVIDVYREKAEERIIAGHDVDVTKPHADFFSSCDAHINHNTAELAWVEKVDEEGSMITSALLGGVIGAVIGVVAVLGMFIFDKKIKSAFVIAPQDMGGVLYSGKGGLCADATVKTAGKICAGGYKKVLVFTCAPVDCAKEFETLLRQKLAEFGNAEVEITSYDNTGKGEIAYKCSSYDAVVAVVDHGVVSANQFVKTLEDIKGANTEYLGAVIYNTNASYLD